MAFLCLSLRFCVLLFTEGMPQPGLTPLWLHWHEAERATLCRSPHSQHEALQHQFHRGFWQPQAGLVFCTSFSAGPRDVHVQSIHKGVILTFLILEDKGDIRGPSVKPARIVMLSQGIWLAMHASIAAHSFGAMSSVFFLRVFVFDIVILLDASLKQVRCEWLQNTNLAATSCTARCVSEDDFLIWE